MAERARAVRRRQMARGVRGPRHLPEEHRCICLRVYLCDSKPPAGGAGGGRAVWTVSPHATEEQRGEDGQARGRGAGGGEDNLDISFFLSLFLYPICYGSIFGIKYGKAFIYRPF